MVAAVGGVRAGATAPSPAGVGSLVGVCSGTVPVGAVKRPAHQTSDEEEHAFNDCQDLFTYQY